MKESIKTTVKEILAVNKNVLKSLHNTFGFNFQENSSVEITEIKVPFTVNRVVKENNITKEKFCVMLLLDKYYGKEKYNNRFNVVVINHLGDIQIKGFYTGWNSGLDDYYRKADFESERKTTQKAFLITANSDDVKFLYKDFTDYSKISLISEQKGNLAKEFFNSKNIRVRSYKEENIRTAYNNNERTVYGIYNAKLNNNNLKIDIDIHKHGFRYETRELHDIIDKSGYNIYAKRWDLETKANQLRSKRELNKLQNMDFSKENENIKNRIHVTKNKLIEKLQNANFNTDEYEKAIKNLRDLNYIFDLYIRHLEKITSAYNNNKDTSSWNAYKKPEDVTGQIVTLNTMLDDLAM